MTSPEPTPLPDELVTFFQSWCGLVSVDLMSCQIFKDQSPKALVGALGVEPRFTVSKTGVLPLDDAPMFCVVSLSRPQSKGWVVPREGLEPSTFGLRIRCTNHCATEAFS